MQRIGVGSVLLVKQALPGFGWKAKEVEFSIL